ncbi:hypothetical protein KJ359_000722 [Pestalotiopsis sp. 9143b]|nr:hypothetical protein KJ359_000722 [Pestalotiopsis sp. 9143b]
MPTLQDPPSFVIHPPSADPAFHQPKPIFITISIPSPVLGEGKACIVDPNVTGAGSSPPGNSAIAPELDRSASGRREGRLSGPDRTETDLNHSGKHLMDSIVDDHVNSFARSSAFQQQGTGLADETPDINDAAADFSRSENRSWNPNTRAVGPGHTDPTISGTEFIIHDRRNLMNRAQGSRIVKADPATTKDTKDFPADSKTTGNSMNRTNASSTVKAEDSKDFPLDSKTAGTNTAPGRQQTRYRLRDVIKTETSASSINRDSTSERSSHPDRNLPGSSSGHSGHGPTRPGQLQNRSPSSQRPVQLLPASNNSQSLLLHSPVVQNSIADNYSHAEHSDAVVTIKPDQQSLEDLVSNLFDKKLAEAQARIAADVIRTIMAPDNRDNLGSDEDMPGDDRRISKTRTGRIVWDHKADIHLMLALFYEMNPDEENWVNIQTMLRKYGFGDCSIVAFKQHLVRIARKHQPDNRYRGNRVLPDRNERPAPALPPDEQSQPAHQDQPVDQPGDQPARSKKRAAPNRDTEVEYYRADQTPEASWDGDMPSEDEHDGLNKRAKKDESDEGGLASVPRHVNPVTRPVQYDDDDGFPRARREVPEPTGTHVGYAHDSRGHTAHHEFRAGGMGSQGNPGQGSFWDLSQDLPPPAAPGPLPAFGEQQPLAPVHGGGGQRPYQYRPDQYYPGFHSGAYQQPMNRHHHQMVQYPQ